MPNSLLKLTRDVPGLPETPLDSGTIKSPLMEGSRSTVSVVQIPTSSLLKMGI